MFTDKAKELFEKFYMGDFKKEQNKQKILIPSDFNSIPLSMQIGVIEDFAESLGYALIPQEDIYLWNYDIQHDSEEGYILHRASSKWLPKQEAREEMIKQLNDLINETDTLTK